MNNEIPAQYGPINIKFHARLDNIFVIAGLLAPWALDFSHLKGATFYTVGLSLFGLGVNLATDYPTGMWKGIPFKWHRVIELLSPPPFIVLLWLFFADAGAVPWFLSAVGIGILLNAGFTRPRTE
jgi:hypothetical protein